MRRPVWLGAGFLLGVGGTLWAGQRVRRRVRRAVEVLSPAVARSEALQAARQMGGRVRDAVDTARVERRRYETELWRRMGEAPPAHRRGTAPRPASFGPRPRGGRRQHR
jgi:hypothetical protein